jgi:hypothetical protein
MPGPAADLHDTPHGPAPAWAVALAHRLAAGRLEPLDRLWADPARVLGEGGLTPDPWQAALLRSEESRILLLCSRQTGKSTTAAALAVCEALRMPGALVLLLSPTERQSGELFRDKVLPLYRALGRPLRIIRQSALQLELANRSRIVSLPENERGIRGFSSVSLLIIDEASRVDDALYFAVRPMLAVSRGRLLALSTPFGKRGWFFDEWQGPHPWRRVKVTAEMCPRISPQFLAEERTALGSRWYAQEYLCSFEDAADAVFRQEDIRAALAADVEPLL